MADDNNGGNGLGSKVFGVAQALVGASLVLKGLRHAGILGGKPTLLTGAGIGAPKDQAGRVPVKLTSLDPPNIEATAKLLVDGIRRDSLTAEVREDALRVLTRKNGDQWAIREKDYRGEVAAIYYAIRNPASDLAVRYVRDHYATDQFHSSRIVKRWRGADCDDLTRRLGAMLRAVGYPLKVRIIAERDDENGHPWSHVYIKVGLPPGAPTKWMALDAAVVPPVAPGWEVPGAENVATTGKPFGAIMRVKDFEV